MKQWILGSLLLSGYIGLGMPVSAQEKPPAHEQEGKKQEEKKELQTSEHQRTSEMPEITVYGKKELKEEQLIGSYEQPRWTAERRFPTTRVYVIPEGKFEFEWWTRMEAQRRGSHEKGHEEQYYYEVEMGLPNRFQLDLYQRFEDTGGKDGSLNFAEQSVELRWAMANWGKIWGNPTWYIEYTSINQARDKEEMKLLLGDELGTRWHWGLNLVREWTVTSPENREVENEITGGVAYTIKDSYLSAGLEAKASTESEMQSDSSMKWYHTFKVGPSMQWKPMPQADIQFVPLVGIGNGSEKYQIWLIAGWEF
jgi:hypothetical protein